VAGGARPQGDVAPGVLWAWGANGEGQLGDGTTIRRSIPIRVNNLDEGKAIVAARVAGGGFVGGGHTLVLRADGTVWAWGENLTGEPGTGIPPTVPLRFKSRGFPG